MTRDLIYIHEPNQRLRLASLIECIITSLNIHERSLRRTRIRKFASLPWDGSFVRHEELELLAHFPIRRRLGHLNGINGGQRTPLRLSGMKRVFVLQTNHQKRFHSVHT